jgi:hypothetical protein
MKKLLLTLALLALPAWSPAAVIELMQGQWILPQVTLSAAQTGNGDSTNVVDRGVMWRGGVVSITSTVGATPTVTVDIKGSMDGTNYYNVPYAELSAPTTPLIAALTITTATTSYYILIGNVPYRYLKLVYSANTNVTLTVAANLQ